MCSLAFVPRHLLSTLSHLIFPQTLDIPTWSMRKQGMQRGQGTAYRAHPTRESSIGDCMWPVVIASVLFTRTLLPGPEYPKSGRSLCHAYISSLKFLSLKLGVLIKKLPVDIVRTIERKGLQSPALVSQLPRPWSSDAVCVGLNRAAPVVKGKSASAGVQLWRVQEYLRDEWHWQEEVHGLWLQCKSSSTLFFNSSDYIELFFFPPPYHHPCYIRCWFHTPVSIFPHIFPNDFIWNNPDYRFLPWMSRT